MQTCILALLLLNLSASRRPTYGVLIVLIVLIGHQLGNIIYVLIGHQLGNIIVCDGVCVARVLGSNKIARGATEGVS